MRLKYTNGQQPGAIQKKSLGIEGTQFTGLRHYFAGDDIRKMAWQATAKLDRPITKTFSPEIEQPIVLLLDASRPMQCKVQHLAKFDWALNCALAFATVALNRGDTIATTVFSRKVLSKVPLGRGQGHFRRLLHTLAKVNTDNAEPDYESIFIQAAKGLKRRSLIVIFTDLLDPIASRSLIKGIQSFSRSHLLVVVTLSDQGLLNQCHTMPHTESDIYQKGVALDILNLREEAKRLISAHKGAMVIDSPAQKLDEALINHYLQLKQLNRF